MMTEITATIQVTVEVDSDAAGDRVPTPFEVAATLADHLLDTWNEDGSVVRIDELDIDSTITCVEDADRLGEIRTVIYDRRDAEDGPPYDAATATGMYDHD